MVSGFWHGRREGSALVESCIVMLLLCIVLFGILQASHLVAARNVINYTAYTTARSASVGLNDFMLFKVSHYASIPTAGPSTAAVGFPKNRPKGESQGERWENAMDRENAPTSKLGAYEVAVKEAYHRAGTAFFDTILDYENWQRHETGIHFQHHRDRNGLLMVRVEQTVPATFPLSHVIFGHLDPVQTTRGGVVGTYPGKQISATAVIEDHSELYLRSN